MTDRNPFSSYFGSEYDSAAEWCAKRGIKGAIGDRLPDLLSDVVAQEINDHPEEFMRRVKEMAYALTMRKLYP